MTKNTSIKIHMKMTVIFIGLCFLSLNSFAQKDSLQALWNNTEANDSLRAEALYQIIRTYMLTDFDSTVYYANELYDFSKENDFIIGMARALSFKAFVHSKQNEKAKAFGLFNQAKELYLEGNNTSGVTYCLTMIAGIYFEQGDALKAISKYEEVLKYVKASSKPADARNALANLGMIYGYQKEYEIAAGYLEESLEISREVNDIWGVMQSVAGLGELYASMGEYEKGLAYLNEALEIVKTPPYNIMKPLITATIGDVYFEKEDYETALSYFVEAIELINAGDDKSKLSAIYNITGETYSKLGDYVQAIKWCNLGLDIAIDTKSITDQKDACQCLYETNKALGKGSVALAYHEKMRAFEDSLNTEETAKKLQQIEFNKQVYQDSVESHEQQRLIEFAHQEEVRKKNQSRNMAFVGGFIALLLAGGFYSRWRYVRKSKAIIEKEKDRSENLLHNILPEEVAAELKATGASEAKDFDNVTVLFTDFVEFTQTAEKLSAKELVTEINVCFKAFDEIMEKYQLEKIKTIGDAYMAAGGLHVPKSSEPKDVILAAIEMQTFMLERKEQHSANKQPAFDMRVGIHSGPVVAGIVGVKKFQYDIWGDTVNTASRMESNGKVGKVNISSDTYQLIKDEAQFTFENRGKVVVKGKGEMEMWFVSNEKSSEG